MNETYIEGLREAARIASTVSARMMGGLTPTQDMAPSRAAHMVVDEINKRIREHGGRGYGD
jgi:hypothetical protein